jgi:hypothetical protein
MNNDEIRLKVAKIKGWTVVQDLSLDMQPWLEDIPNWPVEIADAWELVEEMAIPDEFALSMIYKDCMENIIWECVYSRYEDCGDFGSRFVMADTAPLAICLAYIQWKESQK